MHIDRSLPTLEVYVVMNLCIFLFYAALNTIVLQMVFYIGCCLGNVSEYVEDEI
jgi:hypothetical protein